MSEPRIFVLCPENDKPSGGIKILYRHVDVLRQAGLQAAVLHQQPGFRCSWFANSTEIAYLPSVRLRADDYLVVPEIFGPNMFALRGLPNIGSACRKVIFNQNGYYTFLGYKPEAVIQPGFATPYDKRDEFVAAMVVSEDSRAYLEYAFPGLPVHRIHNAIDQALFYPTLEKKRQICYMPRKHPEDMLQVLAILNLRGALAGFELVPIDNCNEQQVAEIMKASMVFLSFGYPEGCPLPPAEAMACGCVVVGYHGLGGREYFNSAFSYPVPIGDILQFARTAEQALQAAANEPASFFAKGQAASDFIRKHYSVAVEAADIVGCWEEILRN